MVPRESPKPPPLVSLRMFPPQAGASPQWDHPGSQEHTCHCAGAQPAAYTGPTVRATTPSSKTENQDHPNSSSKCYDEKKEKKKYFSGEAAYTLCGRPAQGMPGPQLTSLPLQRAPSQTSSGPPALRRCRGRRRAGGLGRPSLPPRWGAHLLGSGFRRSSSLAAECGAAAATAAAAAAAAFTATAAAAATGALPGASPGLGTGGS